MLSRSIRVALVAAGAALGLSCVVPHRLPGTAPVAKPIPPPDRPLPSEAGSAGITGFAFIAYGDTRSDSVPPLDGEVLHAEHTRLVDRILDVAAAARLTPFPVRFVLQSGDAVLRGSQPAMWDVSFSPIIARLSRAGLPYYFAVGNHDAGGSAGGERGRELGLQNALSATSRLIPPEGSPRRLGGYVAFAFGYGNVFVMAIDSNVPGDATQLAWAAGQLEGLDRDRYQHVVAFFHHPAITSGNHGGPITERESQGIRDRYMPLFRRHHVALVIAGHDHLYDHWVERYTHEGVDYRLDQVVTGGGGAPIYTFTGEPDLGEYLAAGADENLRVEHLARPGPEPSDNPHHFIIVRVDGNRLSLEVVGIGPAPFTPFGGRAVIDLVR